MTDLLALHFRDTNRNTEEYRSYTDWQDTIRNAWTDPEGKKEIYVTCLFVQVYCWKD